MPGIRWFGLVTAAVLAITAVACSDDDGSGGGDDAPASVLTATAIASGVTPNPTGEAASGGSGSGAEYEGDDATDFLDFVLLKPEDIAAADWVVQSDVTTDNDAAALDDPETAPLIETCGRLLGRVITNFPPDSVAAFFDGTTLAFFSQGTVYETAEGAQECAAAAGARLTDCAALARTFGEVFTNPDGVICEPVSYDAVGEGSSAWKLTGQTDAGGTDIGLTILVVSFRDRAATYAVGMAVSGIEPATQELKPYVDLVLARSQQAQQ